ARRHIPETPDHPSLAAWRFETNRLRFQAVQIGLRVQGDLIVHCRSCAGGDGRIGVGQSYKQPSASAKSWPRITATRRHKLAVTVISRHDRRRAASETCPA